LYAAYSVAVSANDAEYLAEICLDLALSLQSDEGKLACEAQDEVLQVADQLYVGGKITENQLLYIRHLVLIREESVASVYDKFQEHLSVPQLAKDLFDLANTHPYHTAQNAEKKANQSQSQQKSSAAASARGNVYDEAEDDSSAYSSDEDKEDEYTRSKANNNETFVDGIHLETLLRALKIDNVWNNAVPKRFLSTVFSAAHRKVLSVPSAKALCDLYQGGYDLVRAAWEVYTVQNDSKDFIDTLQRIVRDLEFDKNGNLSIGKKKAPSAAATTEYGNERPSTAIGSSRASKGTETFKPKPLDEPIVNATSYSRSGSGPTPDELSKLAKDEDRKRTAIAAVHAAKRELLKHSLDMMVKQGLITAVASSRLYDRAANGDVLVDAAIEAYATDRDVSEFLETLQILANHTPEDLDSMLKYARTQSETSSSGASPAPSGGSESNASPDNKWPSIKFAMRQVLTDLGKANVISYEVISVLTQLLSEEDERIYAIYELYLENKDVNELVDSHLRLATSPLRCWL